MGNGPRANIPTSLSLVSDDGGLILSLGSDAQSINDFFHLVLSATASHLTTRPLLRQALAVTDLLMDVPSLNPLGLFADAVEDLLDGLSLPLTLQFLVERGLLSLSFFQQQENSDEVISAAKSDDSEQIYQSADFSCSYLNTFLSQGFISAGRALRVLVQDDTRGECNAEVSLTCQRVRDYKCISCRPNQMYNRHMIREDIGRYEWSSAEEQIRVMLSSLFSTRANPLPQSNRRTKPKEDDAYCEAWKSMMASVREEKTVRQVSLPLLLTYCYPSHHFLPS
jgi:hypothetical protein